MDKSDNVELNGITNIIADFAIKTTFADLPDSVILKTKQILLDSVGCALSGHIVDRTRIALALVGELGGNPQATIIGAGKTSYALAAFANSELIGALDYDPVGPLSPHVVPYVLPACLSLAEREHASGKDLITALAIGHEVGGRMGSSVASFTILKGSPPYYEWSPRFSYTSAIFGAAVATSKILNLDKERLLNTMGIAGASTSVPAGVKWEHYPEQMMLKFGCWSGWLSQLATFAALAAEIGFTGDKTILDTEWGFWNIYGSPTFNVNNLIGQLGEIWHINGVWFKYYPVCGLSLALVDGVNKIMQENRIDPKTIEEISVKGAPNLLTPNRTQKEIKTPEDAQFSPAAAIALGIYHGRKPSASWMFPGTFTDPEIIRLMKLVKVEIHPEAESAITAAAKAGKLQGFFGSIIEITANGKKYLAEIKEAKGTAKNPMTEEEILSKFRDNASYSTLRSNKVNKVIEMVNDLDKVKDINELTKLLAINSA